MSAAPNVRILELMASKICHDLISPVGAVSNGVEILEELGSDAGEDVTGLIAYSAGQAAAKLKVMRMAYGLGGADSSIKSEDVHKIFADFIGTEGRLSQDWNPHAINTHITGAAKMLMACLLLAAETLPKGGKISAAQEDDKTILITAEGENAHFREGTLEALQQKTDSEALEPKHTHAFITGLLASHYNFEISEDSTTPDFIFLRLKLPDVS